MSLKETIISIDNAILFKKQIFMKFQSPQSCSNSVQKSDLGSEKNYVLEHREMEGNMTRKSGVFRLRNRTNRYTDTDNWVICREDD